MSRIFDIILASAMLVILSPILLLVSILIFLSSGTPIVYRQMRVGRSGRRFLLFKFRSMVPNADSLGSYKTTINDVRITALGRILRRFSLDELPQLVNVLKGEMSLVGPRPDTPMQETRYTATEWKKRLSVRPGITGLAQATKRSDANHAERLALDLKYIEQRSTVLDLKILVMTLRKLTGKGSN